MINASRRTIKINDIEIHIETDEDGFRKTIGDCSYDSAKKIADAIDSVETNLADLKSLREVIRELKGIT